MSNAIKIVIVALFLLFYSPFLSKIYAQEMVVETDTPVGVENIATEGSILKVEKINYELPYPGMLPDNPLYFLKAMRDGMVKLLINDDMKMARFSLLNAEKRMFSAKLLTGKNKDKLAVETISKGNNYLIESLSAIRRYQKTHPKSADVKPFLLQLDASSKKLLEVQEDMQNSIDKDYREHFASEHKRTDGIEQTVKVMLRQR